MPLHVLLDECLPRKLTHHLSVHQVSTVQENGWAGMKNGALMKVAADMFDVFVTADQNLQYQQNLAYAKIGVIVLVVPNTRLENILPLLPRIHEVLKDIGKGDVIRVQA